MLTNPLLSLSLDKNPKALFLMIFMNLGVGWGATAPKQFPTLYPYGDLASKQRLPLGEIQDRERSRL
ncbi:hypothetical protein [Nostoc sp.]|uniref:hypothetical protein n=1 Tax=Nostoc sp. TaxID=1180 RepID=UPI002FF92192